GARRLVGVAAQRERARRVADALDVEAGDLLLEAAFAKQHTLLGHRYVREMELRPFLARHELRRLAAAHARRLALDQHRADAADAGTEAHIDEEELGVGRVRGEDLGAIDAPGFAVPRRTRFQIGDRGARIRLSHADRDDALAGKQ